ncbi:hypothetical protein BRARA_G02406 [Brassica rapa]|uniref:FBD domain-containing protein n=1 Tax=Brassica campestris TaxID=3711 RepID=A0A397YQW6_BRACM|nr:hypothetical protein BRARA_G02406 [Brassica rapa]
MRTCKNGRDPNHDGNLSLILLLSIFTNCRAVQLIKDFGNFPCSWLWLTSNDSNLVASPNICGTVPLKLLLLRFSSVRETIEFLKHGGINPLKRLLDKSNRLNLLNLQIHWGNGPSNEFELRSNIWISVSREEFSKLLNKL